MATYTAAGNSKHATLTANTVDVVTLDRAYGLLEIINRDTADLWVTIDHAGANATETTTTPTVAGDGCFYVGPGAVRTFTDDQYLGGGSAPASTVRLISASAVAYSVTGI